MHADLSPEVPYQAHIHGSIRNAGARDATEIARLVSAARVETGALESSFARDDRRHFLVLDVEGALCAVACVLVVPAHARLELLLVDPAIKGVVRHEIEQRMAGVALALCQAFGCLEVDIVPTCSAEG